LLLSIAGGLISGLLLYQHYHTDFELGFFSCAHGFNNPCIAVGQSKFSVLLGIPLPSYGLLFYVFFIFMLLVADYAKEKYYPLNMAILVPVTGAALLSDAVLGIILIRL